MFKPILAALSGCLACSSLAYAQSTSNGVNEVVVGGTTIMRVQVASGGFTAAQRASEIQARVNILLGSGPISPADITVDPLGNEATVDVKGKLLFTADWATARFNQSRPTELANMWADNMRRVLPSLTQAK